MVLSSSRRKTSVELIMVDSPGFTIIPFSIFGNFNHVKSSV